MVHGDGCAAAGAAATSAANTRVRTKGNANRSASLESVAVGSHRALEVVLDRGRLRRAQKLSPERDGKARECLVSVPSPEVPAREVPAGPDELEGGRLLGRQRINHDLWRKVVEVLL